MKEFVFSAFEKYSFSCLQLLSSLFMSNYFGMESIGMIASFTLVVATSIGLCEAGSSFVIMGSNEEKFEELVCTCMYLSIMIAFFMYILIFLFAPLYTEQFSTEIDYSRSLRQYAFIIFTTPLQMVSFSTLIKLKKTKVLSIINLIAWALAILFLVFLKYENLNDHRNVVSYFIILSFLRSIISLIYIFNLIGFKYPQKEYFKIKFRVSVITSQLANSITSNIWTFLVAILVSIESNAVLSIFTKIRDLSSGNLSHSIHRIVYSRIPQLSSYQRKNLILNWLGKFTFLNSIILIFIYLLREPILFCFGSELINENNLLIIFPLSVALFYPLTDYLKALLRYFNNSKVLQIDLSILGLVICLYFLKLSLDLSLFLFLIGLFINGIVVFKNVKKSLPI